MSKQPWLVKQEPETYAWSAFLRDGQTTWDGVRNYQARNHLAAMQLGDPVLFYASVTTKAILGLAEVTRPAFPDPTATEPGWLAVELRAVRPFPTPITLAQIKALTALAALPLLRQSRLSVMPLSPEHYALLLTLGGL